MLKRLLAVSILVFLSVPARGWHEEDHEAMTRLSLEETAREWGLTRPCPVKPLQSLLDKLARLRPEIGDRWHFSDYLKVNPKIDLEKSDPKIKGRRQLTPLEILSLYSDDPDDGRDQDLFVRDERGSPRPAYPDQKWFGVLEGPDSQAFRHMEKPPLSLRHIESTFGFPFRTLGEATLRAEIYFQASLLAFSLDEPYWGWRLLAGALHYIGDLHQPFHSAQITPFLVKKCLDAYLSWGLKKKGLVGTCAHLVSNEHRFYERYVSSPALIEPRAREEALLALKGVDSDLPEGSIQELAVKVRDTSNRHFPELVRALAELGAPVLFTPYRFENKDYDGEPSRFLKSDDGAKAAAGKIFEITQTQFESAGRAIRTVINSSLKNREKKGAGEILEGLDRLLYPTSS